MSSMYYWAKTIRSGKDKTNVCPTC